MMKPEDFREIGDFVIYRHGYREGRLIGMLLGVGFTAFGFLLGNTFL